MNTIFWCKQAIQLFEKSDRKLVRVDSKKQLYRSANSGIARYLLNAKHKTVRDDVYAN